MDRLLSLAKKQAEEAEVFSIVTEETPAVFETNRLKQLQTRQSRMIALRIIRKGRIGLATTTRLEGRESLVQQAVEVSQFGAEAKFELPSAKSYPQVKTYDPEVESLPIEKMVEWGDYVISEVRKHTPELVCEASVTKGIISVHLLNSRAEEASYRKTFLGINLEGTLIRGTDMLFVGESDVSSGLIKDFSLVVESIIEQLELAKNQASAPTGQLPVVFTPRGVANALFFPLTSGLNGRVVLQGASPLARKKGERVFDRRLQLWDDATIPYCPRSRPWDDEGVLSQRTPLIENGVVSNFFYDLQTAGLAHTRSTGNASRINGGLPTPVPNALIIDEGDTSFEDIIKDMKQGLVVDWLMGAEQTNVLGGEFGGNVLLGYKVEAGQIVGRVKDTMVSGNIYQALADFGALGNKARWVMGMIRTPALYCPSLAVSSKQ